MQGACCIKGAHRPPAWQVWHRRQSTATDPRGGGRSSGLLGPPREQQGIRPREKQPQLHSLPTHWTMSGLLTPRGTVAHSAPAVQPLSAASCAGSACPEGTGLQAAGSAQRSRWVPRGQAVMLQGARARASRFWNVRLMVESPHIRSRCSLSCCWRPAAARCHGDGRQPGQNSSPPGPRKTYSSDRSTGPLSLFGTTAGTPLAAGAPRESACLPAAAAAAQPLTPLLPPAQDHGPACGMTTAVMFSTVSPRYVCACWEALCSASANPGKGSTYLQQQWGRGGRGGRGPPSHSGSTCSACFTPSWPAACTALP